MKPSAIPMSCSLALAALCGAVVSHWWSIREFAGLLANSPPAAAAQPPPAAAPLIAATAPAAVVQPAPPPTPKVIASQPAAPPAAVASAAQKEFFESLIDEMKQLKKTNLALRDQMAETNRDLMQLEFRVDTQSASFRPLPVTEDLSTLDTTSLDSSALDASSLDSGPGVLPPRAVMVAKPN